MNVTFHPAPSVNPAPISWMIPAWNMTAAAAARIVDRPNTTRAGIFLAIITAVRTGTTISQGLRLNLAPSMSVYLLTVAASAAG